MLCERILFFNRFKGITLKLNGTTFEVLKEMVNLRCRDSTDDKCSIPTAEEYGIMIAEETVMKHPNREKNRI